jgi:hypothetical protein
MRALRTLLLVAFATGFGIATSHAQSTVTASFDFTCPSVCAPGDNTPLTPVTPEGEITFTVLNDGNIAATLVDSNPNATINGFGFDACLCNLLESGWTPGLPDNFFGWDDGFGSQISGFGSYTTQKVPLTESWIIDGSYTSVGQIMNGGDSSVNFVLIESSGAFGADVEGNYPVSSVPEGGASLMFLLLAAGACFGAMFLSSRIRSQNCASA